MPAPADLTDGLGRRIVRNLTMQSGTQLTSMGFGVLTTYFLSRKLGVEAYGGFRFLFTFIYFFQALNDLGISMLLTREIARAPERASELVQQLLGFKILLALVLMCSAWGIAQYYPMEPFARLAVCMFALVLPIQAMSLPMVIMQARVEIRRASIVELVNRLTGFVLMMTAVFLGFGLLAVTAALVCGELAGAIAVWALTRHTVTPLPKFDVAVWRRVVGMSLPLGATALLVALVNRVDFMMLEAMAGLRSLGYYAAAYTVTGMFEKVPVLIMGTLFPMMSQMAAGDPAPLAALYHRSIRNFMLAAVPVVLLVMWLAPVIVRVQFGPGYEPTVGLLRVLIWATGCLYVAISAGNLLIALGHQRINMLAFLVAAVVNVGLNVMWIPRFGSTGAAWATAISYVIVLAIQLAACERLLSARKSGAPIAPSAQIESGVG